MRIDDKGEEDEGIYRNNQQIPIEGKIKNKSEKVLLWKLEKYVQKKVAVCVILSVLGQQYYKCSKCKKVPVT